MPAGGSAKFSGETFENFYNSDGCGSSNDVLVGSSSNLPGGSTTQPGEAHGLFGVVNNCPAAGLNVAMDQVSPVFEGAKRRAPTNAQSVGDGFKTHSDFRERGESLKASKRVKFRSDGNAVSTAPASKNDVTEKGIFCNDFSQRRPQGSQRIFERGISEGLQEQGSSASSAGTQLCTECGHDLGAEECCKTVGTASSNSRKGERKKQAAARQEKERLRLLEAASFAPRAPNQKALERLRERQKAHTVG